MPNIHSNISFALVNIPVILNPIIKNNDTRFHQLHKKCFHRVQYVKYCPQCKKNLKETDIIKGYEYEKEQYVTFEKKELNALKLPNEKEILIVGFVPMNEIDPIYLEKSYFIGMDSRGKAYGLFLEALKKSKRVALAKTVIGSKFYYCILRFIEQGLILTTLYFEEEVHIPLQTVNKKFADKELKIALDLIQAWNQKFEPEKYKDEYQKHLQEAIQDKLHGIKLKQPKAKPKRQVSDLMKALERSLKETK